LLFHRRDGAYPRAVVLGCAGPTLTDAEAKLFAAGDPLGFILFARNVVDPPQVAALCAALRASVGREDAPILVDQEGGRVQRLRPPHWRAAPPAASFAALHAKTPHAAREAARLNARLIAWDCLRVGMNVICAPCGDLPAPGAHDVIGDRAFGRDVETVVALARATADGIADLGGIPVLKHLPGHGRAAADSHHELPTVTVSRADLVSADAAVFRALRDLPWAMTAHVLYTALDTHRPGTVSPDVIEFIRREIGFDGVLVSDDLAMNALGGTPVERARAALAAGCDVALYCAGTPESAEALLREVPLLTDRAAERIACARDAARPRLPPAPQHWVGRFDALMNGLGP
jgi:beta-N-acetylhexosaminidase